MKVVTAKSGKVLREYAASKTNVDRVVIFPENGLDPNEEAAFITENAGKFDEIITFSPFILSDMLPENIVVLDFDGTELYDDTIYRQGCSVNWITMTLWRASTTGDVAIKHFDDIRETFNASGNSNELVDELCKKANKMGDSVEKTLLIHMLLNNGKEL